jgi:hypothetical protein
LASPVPGTRAGHRPVSPASDSAPPSLVPSSMEAVCVRTQRQTPARRWTRPGSGHRASQRRHGAGNTGSGAGFRGDGARRASECARPRVAARPTRCSRLRDEAWRVRCLEPAQELVQPRLPPTPLRRLRSHRPSKRFACERKRQTPALRWTWPGSRHRASQRRHGAGNTGGDAGFRGDGARRASECVRPRGEVRPTRCSEPAQDIVQPHLPPTPLRLPGRGYRTWASATTFPSGSAR